MRSLILEASSLDSADDLCGALSSFDPELSGNEEDGYQVSVELKNANGHLIAVLEAVQEYAAARGRPARVELGGRRYSVQPE